MALHHIILLLVQFELCLCVLDYEASAAKYNKLSNVNLTILMYIKHLCAPNKNTMYYYFCVCKCIWVETLLLCFCEQYLLILFETNENRQHIFDMTVF